MSAFVFWFLCGVVYLLLFGQLSPRKKKSFKQVTDGMFIFCLYSFPTFFCFTKCALQLCHIHLENSLLQAGL